MTQATLTGLLDFPVPSERTVQTTDSIARGKPNKGVSKLPEGLFVCSLEALGCGAVFYVAVLEMLPDSLEGGWTVLKEPSSS